MLTGQTLGHVCVQEARIKSAVEFLQQPRVVYAGRDTKIKYLQEKCKLTADELDTAFKTAAKELETKEKGTAEVKKEEETSGGDFGTGEKKAGEANGGRPCRSSFLSLLSRLVCFASLSVDVRTQNRLRDGGCGPGVGAGHAEGAAEAADGQTPARRDEEEPRDGPKPHRAFPIKSWRQSVCAHASCVCWAQGEMEEFHSHALQDDLPSEEEEEAVVEIPVGDDY